MPGHGPETVGRQHPLPLPGHWWLVGMLWVVGAPMRLFVLCVSILGVTIYEKFGEGGWATLLITGLLLAVCIGIKRHYAQVKFRLRRLEVALADLPASEKPAPPIDPLAPTAPTGR